MALRRRRRAAPDPGPPSFQQCESCDYDFATGEGERSCAYFECPYLPDELKVTCPDCMFNFAANDGNPDCGDPPDCDFAVNVVPARLAALEEWLRTRPVIPD